MKLSLIAKLHMYHRFWRYRLRTEKPDIRYLRSYDLDGKTVVDIGANKGVYSYWMSKKVGEHGAVFAFEPQPELGVHLEKLKNSFGLNNLRIENTGLSSSSGILNLIRPEAGSGTASFHLTPGAGLEAVEVPVTTLDEYFNARHRRPISFIKCDVQEHEFEVFKGGQTVLAEDRPVLLFECYDELAEQGEFFSFLTNLGYDGFFYHVTRSDHASYLHRGRGKYVHYSQFRDYPYVRPGIHYRNYIFVRNDEPIIRRPEG